MGNPLTYIGRGIAKYARDLKDAPAAQYAVRSAAPAVIPNTTEMPPPTYQPAVSGRPLSLSQWSIDDEIALEKERQKAMETLVSGPVPGEVRKKKRNSSIFDAVVKAAGSKWALLFTLLLLGFWAALGVVYGPTDTWQVILQDISSIQCYISATLLMRQQQNATRGLLNTIGEMISRSTNNERMMRLLSEKQLLKLKRSQRPSRRSIASSMQTRLSIWARISSVVSRVLGSLWALLFYWIGIGVWVVWGFPLQFSDTWQLYVNTATALELTFTTMFLQSVRQQHEIYLENCLKSIDKLDRELELDLRRMTGDLQANPVIDTKPLTLGRIEKAIDTWAFVIGGSVGVVLSVTVFGVWLAIGKFMAFDDNWFLIIGTYTGLMGFVDGFIMRNAQHREDVMADKQFNQLANQDFRLFYQLDIPFPENVQGQHKKTLAARISQWIGHMCDLPGASVASVLTVIILLIVASAMQWTVTGQLLCNTPTMIIEGFLLLVLIEGHNQGEIKQRDQYTGILERRLMLERRIGAWQDRDYELEVQLLEDKSIDVLSISEKYI